MKKGNLIPEILICTLISYRQWAIWLHGNDTLSTLGEASANLTAEHVSRVIKGSSRWLHDFCAASNQSMHCTKLCGHKNAKHI